MRTLAVLLLATSTAYADTGAVSTDVLDLAQRRFALSLDVSFATRFAVRAEVGFDREHYSSADSSYRVFGLASEGEYVTQYGGGHHVSLAVLAFVERTHHGAFVEAGVRGREFSDQLYDVSYSDNYTGVAPRLMIGWQQTLDFGLTIAAAAGAQYEWLSSDTGKDESRAGVASYIRVGYVF
jgi:hypothetical protein